MKTYYDLAFSPSVLKLQESKGSKQGYELARQKRIDQPSMGFDELEFIKSRDSLYLASMGQTGWPYLQHRGGDEGFVKILGGQTIGWVERRGNRQYLSTGNITANQNVALIMVDYPARARLKLLGHASYHHEPPQELTEAHEGDLAHDGAITIEVVAFDWNCPKYITPRFTSDAVRSLTNPLHEKIAELEARLAEYEDSSGSDKL